MAAKTIRDPNGNELKLVLLQVMERGPQGPTLCRVRYDHETVDIGNASEIQREFLLVWSPVDSVLGELRTSDNEQLNTMQEARDLLVEAREEIANMQRLANQVREHATALQEEVNQKTAALRELQRERDPARLEAMVAARVDKATEQWRGYETAYRAEIATLKSRVTELEASKRKLRDALDRLKDKR